MTADQCICGHVGANRILNLDCPVHRAPAVVPAGPAADLDLAPLETTDARVWASAFVQMHGGDEGLMLAWFANAIETGRAAASSPGTAGGSV